MQVEKNPIILNQLGVIFSSFIEFAILYSAKLQIKEIYNLAGYITFRYLKKLSWRSPKEFS